MDDSRLKALLNDLGQNVPPSGVKTDDIVLRGRRQVQRRTYIKAAGGALALALAAPVAINIGMNVHDDSPQVSASTIPTSPSTSDGNAPDTPAGPVETPKGTSTAAGPEPPPGSSPNIKPPSAVQTGAYETCADLVTLSARARGEGSPEGLEGRVGVSGEGVTVVVGNGTQSWACNVDPDQAVSAPRSTQWKPSQPLRAEMFSVAKNARSNYEFGQRGKLVWGGGPLPDAVDALSFRFPDGHVQKAVIDRNHWVMQYLSSAEFDYTDKPIVVIVKGVRSETVPGGRLELELSWGTHTCNQVTHGC